MFGRVLVGVDGSDGSVPALQWAIEEAAWRGAVVEAVLAWQGMSTIGLGEVPYLPDEESRIETTEQARLARAIGEAVARVPGGVGVTVDPVVVEGGAAEVLCERSDRADLLVVGCRGHGPVSRLLVGSVSSACLQHARCPTVVVPLGRGRPEHRRRLHDVPATGG
ncbi:MAG: universal stress protein [Actinomycetota bacterium]|jgi:nucleotide-binding universal stress UspA family protein|nr:universal stress protein [Actinomycetota bacterium]